MKDIDKTAAQLVNERSGMRRRIAELEALEDERRLTKQALQKAYDELERRIEERTEALEWYTADSKKRTEVACIFRHLHVPDVDDNVATAAYRIAQEALTNVARLMGSPLLIDHCSQRSS